MGDIKANGILVAKEGENTSVPVEVGNGRTVSVSDHKLDGYAYIEVRYDTNAVNQLTYASGRIKTINSVKIVHEKETTST